MGNQNSGKEKEKEKEVLPIELLTDEEMIAKVKITHYKEIKTLVLNHVLNKTCGDVPKDKALMRLLCFDPENFTRDDLEIESLCKVIITI